MPRTAKQFAAKWSVPKGEQSINGNDDIPNIYHRQDRLVGQVLDACIILHVYEELLRGTNYESLKPLLPKQFSKKQYEQLLGSSDEVKLDELVKMSQNKHKDKHLKGHRDLLKKEDWEEYLSSYKTYLAEYDIYKDSLTKAIDDPSAGTPANKPVMPKDPRVELINQMIRPTIQILDSGPKEAISIEAKTLKKHTGIDALRDLNRICVLPTKPEYADNFVKVIAKLNPPKLVNGQQQSRFFEEQPETFEHGYYNKKLILALDRSHKKEGTTNGNIAALGEIKIIPEAMFTAEKLSATIKKITDLLIDPQIYIAHPEKKDACKAEKNCRKLEIAYTSNMAEFKKLSDSFGVNYSFPELYLPEDSSKDVDKKHSKKPKSTDKISTGKVLNPNLRDELLELAIRIHIDAISNQSTNRSWKEEYLKATISQELGYFPEYAEKMHKVLPTDVTRKDILDDKWLGIVADSGSLSLTDIDKKLRQKFDLPEKPFKRDLQR